MLNNFRRRRPLTVYIIVMRLIFVARTDYENKSTMKIYGITNLGLHLYEI